MQTTTPPADKFPLLPVIVGFFVAVLVLNPSCNAKFLTLGTLDLGFIQLGPLNIPGATVIFPLTFVFNDLLTEVYGFERSRRIIWIGLAAQIFAAATYALIQIWPAAPFWQNQAAYDAVLGQAPRIVLGSFCAYCVGEFVNSFCLSKLKFRQQGKTGCPLAARFVLSTVVGEFFDSAIFMTVAFLGQLPLPELLRSAVTIWVLKSLYEIVALPFSMMLVAWMKRREGIDRIDDPATTNYSPFRF